VIIITTIKCTDSALEGEDVLVAADVDFEGVVGIQVGPIMARLDGCPLPLTAWEITLARTKLEFRFMEIHRLAWEDRAA
jgi:hypothetical protein